MPKSSPRLNQDAAPASLETLTARIQRDFTDMTPQFQVGARHLLDFPLDIPVASMRKIAEQAGVQPATLLRLAKSLCYAGWPELKAAFVQSMQKSPKRYADRARELLHETNPDNALAPARAESGRASCWERVCL